MHIFSYCANFTCFVIYKISFADPKKEVLTIDRYPSNDQIAQEGISSFQHKTLPAFTRIEYRYSAPTSYQVQQVYIGNKES